MNPVDALQAAGLNPIVIDENFDFATLTNLISNPPAPKDNDENRSSQTHIRVVADDEEQMPKP